MCWYKRLPEFCLRSTVIVATVLDRGCAVDADRLGKGGTQTAVLGLKLTDAFVGGSEPRPQRWVRSALSVGDDAARRGTLPLPETFDLGTQVGWV